jgi:hypothetical protein
MDEWMNEGTNEQTECSCVHLYPGRTVWTPPPPPQYDNPDLSWNSWPSGEWLYWRVGKHWYSLHSSLIIFSNNTEVRSLKENSSEGAAGLTWKRARALRQSYPDFEGGGGEEIRTRCLTWSSKKPPIRVRMVSECTYKILGRMIQLIKKQDGCMILAYEQYENMDSMKEWIIWNT